ncbi:nucleotide sugar dehydrogenase [Rhodohalobacter sp. 614A]|uniref:nucleotide sugar dehydrogenase n=1 Tax=Rhodohalobacter sp. 614A TaxID=2908649 RepID=UPI001F1DA25E|nr:nucleotide sugar dehydrogenase [Rhodohalobacter sp. 614A]
MGVESLLQKIQQREYTIGIIGLGYVGLPLLWTFHEKGMPVIGFDIDENKVNCINQGIPYIKHLGEDKMKVLADSDLCRASSDFSKLVEADALLMCVPTPLNLYREPEMKYVIQTTEVISKYLRKDQLVILESTTWPGTTVELIIPMLEKETGLISGKDFYVAYSPEREDPGNADFNTSKIPKVVGADGEDALKLACEVYNTAIVRTVPVSNTKTAEAVKLTENIFRSINIALVNELKVVYKEMGIDVHEVLDAAETKPFGFMKFTPGPGLGGHCIPIDPFYLTWKARQYQQNTRFIELAGEINTEMPNYVVNRAVKALNSHKKAVNGSSVLIVGLAYKPNVDDDRESPSYRLMDLFDSMGAEVSYYDPYVPVIKESREHSHWAGLKSVEWSRETMEKFDVVVISTNHSDIDYRQLSDWSDLIVDTRNSMKDVAHQNGHVWKA